MHRLRILCIVVALIVAFPARAFAAPVNTDTAVISQGNAELDGQEVRFSGEAIGEALRAPRGEKWVNVLDEGVAIGVVVPPAMLAGIDGFGEWSRVGTLIEVTGVLNVGCDVHGGDLDVHATELRVLAPSEPVDHPASPRKALAALVALGVSVALGARFRAAQRRKL